MEGSTGVAGLAGLAEAPTSAEAHGVGVGLVQGVFGVEGQYFGVGAHGPGEGGVAFNLGPGGK
ncbi:hypothetical protein ABZY06_21910 [Streptomyces sp. NPDC006540]|jgi:hypothetical protein|uniref:hypothetical protein n=1 Tax=Streptomyces sp. NPDC006540 TaxID=3155353 RepID=UPI0033BCB2BB